MAKHWGRAGRITSIGSLEVVQSEQILSYRLIAGKCHASKVLPYLETLCQEAQKATSFTVVLDNAGFHRAKIIQNEPETWEQDLFFLRFLPPYSPQLNPMEIICKQGKHFSLPRRCYP